MLDDCLKVTSYFGERTRVNHRFFSDVLLDTFEEFGVSNSILLRATSGFGLSHHLRDDQTLTMSEDPSLMVVGADTPERIEPMLTRIGELQPKGMFTVERARVIRGDTRIASMPEELHEATKLTIYLGRGERVYRMPAHLAVCDLLHRRGVAGASVLLGVDGTQRGVRERARFFDRNVGVPTMVIAMGEGALIERVLPELGGLLEHPLITVERVRVCKRDGELLARPHPLPNTDADGLGMWQKLMIYTSEWHTHKGEPIHRSIVKRLRATNARGATVLRGVWGFHGEHEPHGDRLWQLGRRVPVVTIVVDTPSNIARSFDVIDELTSEHGLVTCELVPAMQYFGHDAETGSLQMSRYRF